LGRLFLPAACFGVARAWLGGQALCAAIAVLAGARAVVHSAEGTGEALCGRRTIGAARGTAAGTLPAGATRLRTARTRRVAALCWAAGKLSRRAAGLTSVGTRRIAALRWAALRWAAQRWAALGWATLGWAARALSEAATGLASAGARRIAALRWTTLRWTA
jgi:hypothetical protein